MSLYQRLCGHAEFQPDKIAIDSDAGQLTYSELKILANQCAVYFQSVGVMPGDRVAILSLNHPDWFIAVFAAAQCGVVLVPLNWRLSVDELHYVITDSDPVLLFYDKEFSDTASALHKDGMQLCKFATDEFPPIPATDQVSFCGSWYDDTVPFLLVYTSGTTGRPKGAVLNQRALMCSAEMSQHMTDLTANDRVLNVLPLFHVGGLNIQPLPALLYGATLVLHSRFNPDAAADVLGKKRITLVNSVPTILQAMLASPQWKPENYTALRAISIGSTDVPVSLIEQVHECGIPLIQVYGATETGPVAIYQRVENASMVGSIGRVGLLCEVRLCDEEGSDVASGQAGEIHIKGDNLLSFYWNNNEATAANVVDGWFRTGDVAHRDDKGFYWFDDRLKHVVISGGENIYPAELERVISEVQGVDEVAVVGRADERWGEVPVAVIVGSADKQTVLNSCESLARFKRPKDVVFVEALPRNALGKIQVHEVKKLVV